MPLRPSSVSALLMLAFPGVVFAAGPAWPASKERLAAVASKPDAATASALVADSDAAFEKRAFADAVALRSLARLDAFMAKHPLPDGLRAWMIENRAPAEEFVGLLSRHDDAKAVAKILGGIWEKDEKGFRALPRLAMAIALVYDTEPPPVFPHGQVAPKTLPRKLNDPLEVFAFYKESSDAKRLALPLDKLAIDETAFVVGFVTPLAEMREAQSLHVNRSDVSKLYFSVNYDKGRYTSREYMWPGNDYSLPAIRKKGGICVDQAYYSSSVAQANGIPAFILTGSGNDGNHAFVGYLMQPGKWKTDVGRYESQKYATGTAWNPLTWGELTDHELAALQERLQNTPSYATATLYAEKAAEAVGKKDFDTARKWLEAGRSADSRCAAVWNVMAALASARGDSPDKQEKLYAAAAAAMARYREVETEWRYRLADILEKEGKVDAANEERLAIVRRNSRARPELAAALAEKLMESAVKAGDPKKEMLLFGKLTNQFEDAGMEFFRRIAFPFVNHLLKTDRQKEAKQAARTVSQRFKFEKGSQLEELRNQLVRTADSGKPEEPKA